MIKYLLLLVAFFVASCQTSIPIHPGIQKGYEAVNPAAIIAVPIFVLPDPSLESSSIDPSLLITEKIIPSLENKIIESFNQQPNINGYPFAVVKKAISYDFKPINNEENKEQSTNRSSNTFSHGKNERPTNNEVSQLKKNKPLIWDRLNSSLKSVAGRFSSRDIKTRLLMSPNCLARKNFIEFYSYCLASDTEWLAGLNDLSARVLNADSALITVVLNLEDKIVDKKYQITGAFAILLVDTNNGKLVWGNYKKETLENSEDKKYFPSWNELIHKVLAPDFWNGFPGRIGKNQLKMPDE